ncbi:MAG: hypothetical protein H0X65_06655 [Gemmatimonadetes bacterium]|nr:hypothetical protein [Gemmatimonadota bacterium]
MSSYTQRQFLKEVEWQTRAALSVFDDLDGARVADDPARVDAIVHNLTVRIHRLTELLWPGRSRVGDRLFADEVEEMRRHLGVHEGSPITRKHTEPLVALVRYEAAGVRLSTGEAPPSLIIDWGGGSYDVLPARRELQRLWSQATDLLFP